MPLKSMPGTGRRLVLALNLTNTGQLLQQLREEGKYKRITAHNMCNRKHCSDQVAISVLGYSFPSLTLSQGRALVTVHCSNKADKLA